jgi:predicted ArsR family transcriptional regulator
MGSFTQKKIMDFLRQRHAATTLELSRALGKTRADIYHHLVDLEMSNLVEVINKNNQGRGRPRYVYAISSSQMHDGMDKLTIALLDGLFRSPRRDKIETNIRALAERMRLYPGYKREGSMRKRLDELVNFLNERNYQARWEASAIGARIILERCPYATIIDKHPELCCVDFNMIKVSFEKEVQHTARLESWGVGVKKCVFHVF